MAALADDLIDRRRLRRKLSFWRVAAILLVAAIVVGGAMILVPGLVTWLPSHIR